MRLPQERGPTVDLSTKSEGPGNSPAPRDHALVRDSDERAGHGQQGVLPFLTEECHTAFTLLMTLLGMGTKS